MSLVYENVKDFDYTSVFVDTKGIFRWSISSTPKNSLNAVIESDNDLKELLEEDKMPLMIDLTRVNKIDMGCDNYYSNNFKQFFYAGVILVKTAVSKMLAELIILNNTEFDIPIVIVNSEEEGRNYLQSINAIA